MKLLREFIRELLAEAAVSPASLHPKDVLYVRPTRYGPAGGFQLSIWRDKDIIGSMAFQSMFESDSGKCLNAYEVTSVQATHGYGPLLYDIAIELATAKGSGLVPDRRSVSDSALDVWNYYLKNRPDVQAVQLDLVPKEGGPVLTPDDPSDDCSQSSAVAHNVDVHDSRELRGSSLTKMYRLKVGGTPTLDALRKMGRLVELPVMGHTKKPSEAPRSPTHKNQARLVSDKEADELLKLLGF
jgi:hypothetical protein